MRLEPDESRILSWSLDLQGLRPGEYEVEFVYYAATQNLVRDVHHNLLSNAVRFRIVDEAKRK